MASWTGACAGRAAADCDARATTRAAAVSPNAARTSEETSSMTTPARRAARVDRRVGWVGGGARSLGARGTSRATRGALTGAVGGVADASTHGVYAEGAHALAVSSDARLALALVRRAGVRVRVRVVGRIRRGGDVRARIGRVHRGFRVRGRRAGGGTFSLEEAPASAAGVPTFPADASAGVVRSRGLDSGGGDAGAGTLETIPARAHIRRSGPSGRFDIGPAPPRARGARAFEINTTTTCAGTIQYSLALRMYSLVA